MALKTGYISPIYKDGDQGLPKNNRPVCSFDILSHKNIWKDYERKDGDASWWKHFNETQHSFRSGQ